MQPPVWRGPDGGLHIPADLVSQHLSRGGKTGWSTTGLHPQNLPHIAWHPYGLPASATWYQLLRKQMHTGTPPLTLQKQTDLHAHGFARSPELWRHPRLANVTWACRWRLCGINPAITLSLLQCFLKYNVMETRNYTFPGHKSYVFLTETCTSVIFRPSSHGHIKKRVAIIFTRYSTTSFIVKSKWSFHLSQSLHLFLLWYTNAQCATVLQRIPFLAVNTVLLGYENKVNIGRA